MKRIVRLIGAASLFTCILTIIPLAYIIESGQPKNDRYRYPVHL